jgi:flagellar FliL protein
MSAPDAGPSVTGSKKPGGKKRLLLLAAPALLAAIGAGLWFGGILPPLLGMGEKPHGEATHEGAHGAKEGAKEADAHGGAGKPPVFMDLPEIIANLNAGPRKAAYVKVRPKLELARAEDEATIKAALPRLMDLFQTYLREMRPEELRGSAGTYRLREELLARANIAVAPARVVDVLFPEMLVQ